MLIFNIYLYTCDGSSKIKFTLPPTSTLSKSLHLLPQSQLLTHSLTWICDKVCITLCRRWLNCHQVFFLRLQLQAWPLKPFYTTNCALDCWWNQLLLCTCTLHLYRCHYCWLHSWSKESKGKWTANSWVKGNLLCFFFFFSHSWSVLFTVFFCVYVEGQQS